MGLLKIKDTVWESFKIEYSQGDLACIAITSMTDRPVVGMIIDTQFNFKGRILQYLLSFDGQKAWYFPEELLKVEVDKNNKDKIGF